MSNLSKGQFKNYVIILGGGGEVAKRLHKITRGRGKYTKRLHWITRGRVYFFNPSIDKVAKKIQILMMKKKILS